MKLIVKEKMKDLFILLMKKDGIPQSKKCLLVGLIYLE